MPKTDGQHGPDRARRGPALHRALRPEPESCWKSASASVKYTMNPAGRAPGLLSLRPHATSASCTNSGVTHRVSTPNRSSSDSPTHGCIRQVYQMPATRVALNYLHHTSNGIVCPAENDTP